MKRIGFWILVLMLLVVAGCDDENGPAEVGTDPEITAVRIPAGWNLLSDEPVTVEATIRDPQGVADIGLVRMEVQNGSGNVIFSDTLYDEGGILKPEAGDVFARDGIFTNRFLTSAVSDQEGLYTFHITASDLGDHTSAVYEQAIRFGFNVLPVITGLAGADSLSSGGQGFLYAAVFDENGNEEVEEVRFDIYRGADKITLEPVRMFNGGDYENSGDLFAGDSIYSYKMNAGFAAGRKGWYELRFSATDAFEEAGPEKARTVFLENEAGALLSVNVPDRIEKPTVSFDPSDSTTYNRALVRVQVSDPQTLADVDSVYFYSRKPDGELARDGEPLVLVDNGLAFNIGNPFVEAGDDAAGDGEYALTVIIYNDPATQLGTYIWSFYMRDKGGNLTPVTVDSIEVYQ